MARRPPDFEPGFLVDLESGDHVGVSLPFLTAFSADGKHAAWARAERRSSAHVEIVVTDLGVSPQETRATSIVVVAQTLFGLALSGDGSRLAVLEGDRLRVHETATGRLLGGGEASVAVSRRNADVGFHTDDKVRVYSALRELHIVELDLGRQTTTQIAAIPVATYTWSRTADHGRLLVCAFDDSMLLVDAHGGTVIAELAAPCGRLLDDGSVVARQKQAGGRARLLVISRDGVETGSFEIEPRMRLGEEVTRGVLLAQTWTPENTELLGLVDLRQGRFHDLGPGSLVRAGHTGPGVALAPGSPGARLAWSSGLVRVDPLRGTLEPVR
jgi:hypothetical protein